MFEVTRLEIARNMTRLGIYCLIGFLLVSVIILQLGLEKLKLDEKQGFDFSEVQLKRLEVFMNYQQYGAFGIDRLLRSSPLLYMFHNSSTLNELQANIDISTRYKLYKPEMGKNLFARPTGGSLDFSWFYLVFGTLGVSLWSFLISRNKDYKIFLNNFSGIKGVYWGIMLGRGLLIMTANLIILAVCALQFLVNGATLGPGEIYGLLYLFLVSTLMMVIFAAVTGGLGAAKDWKKGVIKTAILWIVLVLIWPEALNAIFARKAEISLKSLEEHQKQKNELYLPFEKKALKNTGRYETQPGKEEADKQSAEEYWTEVSQRIREIDLKMIEKIEKLSRSFHFCSIFNPVTYYKSVNNELGSKGYNSYNMFFKENLEIQRKFLRHVFNKRYYENYTKVEPFLPAGELVVQAKPSLSAYFHEGLIFIFLLMVLSLYTGYFLHKSYMYPKPVKADVFQEVDINAEKGQIVFISCENQDLNDTVTNVTRGYPQGFNGKIIIDNLDVAADPSLDIDFIPNYRQVPGNIRVEQLLEFIGKTGKIANEKINRFKQDYQDRLTCRFSEIEPVEGNLILLDLCRLRDGKIYVLKDFSAGIFQHNIYLVIEKLEALKEKGVLILCLSDIFMRTDKTYQYSYNRTLGKYVDMEKYYESKREAERG
jgi:hypothetical protein